LSLAAHGRLSLDLAQRLALAASRRNVLVHGYAIVDVERIAKVVRDDLGDLRLFAAAAAQWLKP
ncbi:MAG: HepT-like ribonuclease domain-containing protein, partial [Myxococcales bacterium]